MDTRNVVVGISGGIAAYKAAELVRRFLKADFYVRVAMTKNAARFVSPLTFEALSANRVISDMFAKDNASIEHITWGQESDLIIIAPATANIIAKMAQGVADDFLSTMLVAASAKILVCPSMNSRMFMNPAVQANIGILKKHGHTVMSPGEGDLACHTEGTGRLPEPEEIFEQALDILTQKDFSGLKVLVTAGPTVEPVDPVRYISNRSSGKMGYALARAARRRGAAVILVSGPVALKPPLGVKLLNVKTAREMREAVLENRPDCQVIIKAAAVSDYRPVKAFDQKMKKGPATMTIALEKNPDILAELGRTKNDFPGVLVGFAAETEDLLVNAGEKLRNKALDMIVANDVSRDDAGFETNTNIVKIIHASGQVEDLPLMTKDEVAFSVLDRVKTILNHVIK
jgi:phosphopantothenoylcysteine decarboxylase/phosphopantothenate--cysteine ligase